MASSVSGRLVLSLVLSCVLRSVDAQGIVGDSALIDEAAKMEPRESMIRGDTKLTLNQHDAGTKDANGWYFPVGKRRLFGSIPWSYQ